MPRFLSLVLIALMSALALVPAALAAPSSPPSGLCDPDRRVPSGNANGLQAQQDQRCAPAVRAVSITSFARIAPFTYEVTGSGFEQAIVRNVVLGFPAGSGAYYRPSWDQAAMYQYATIVTWTDTQIVVTDPFLGDQTPLGAAIYSVEGQPLAFS